MSFVYDKIKRICEKLYRTAHQKLYDIVGMEYVKAPGYKVDNRFPEEGWEPFPAGSRVQGWDAHYWFRCSVHTPEKKEERSFSSFSATEE